VETLATLAFPALVLLLVIIAVLEALWVWFTGLGLVPWLRERTGRSITTATMTDLTQVFEPGKQAEIEHHAAQEERTDKGGDAAPEDPSFSPDLSLSSDVSDSTEVSDPSVGRPLRTMSVVDLERGVVYLPPSRDV
jgi:hypothetical protein